jgi:hypothetical protein
VLDEERAVRGHFNFELVFLVISQNFGESTNSPDYGNISRVFRKFKVVSLLTRNTPNIRYLCGNQMTVFPI